MHSQPASTTSPDRRTFHHERRHLRWDRDIDGRLCTGARRAAVRVGILARRWTDERLRHAGMTSVLDAAADDGACRASVGFAAVLVGEIRHGDEAAIANVLVAGHRAFTDQELLGAVAALIRALTDEIARLSGLDVAEVDRNLAAQDRDAVLRSIGRCGSRSRRI